MAERTGVGMRTSEFISLWLKSTKHKIELRALPSKHRTFTRSIDDMAKFCKEHKHENVYFGIYTRNGGGKREDIREAVCLFADMDFKGYDLGEAEAREILASFELKPSLIVSSGNGLHLYWFLNEPIENAYEQESKIKSILKGIAVKLLSDTSVADIARIFRLPNTFNHKTDPAKKVEVAESNDNRYSLADFEQYAVTQGEPLQDTPLGNKAESIAKRCKFLQFCKEKSAELPEPLWYAMLSNVSRLVNGIDMCHELSSGYRQYSPAEVDKKILHALNASNPMSCSTIKELMVGYGYQDCGMSCTYKSPAANVSPKTPKNGGTPPTQDQPIGENDSIQTKSMLEIMKATANFIDNRVLNRGFLSGITTGFSDLDEITDGWQPGNLAIIAARPSIGKSALMLNMAEAASKNCPVGIVSLEMSDIEKGIRFIAASTGISINKLRKGFLDEEDIKSYVRRAGELSNLPIYYQYDVNNEKMLESSIDIFVKKHGCRVVFIDHLHLMHAESRQQSRDRELAVLTRTAKKLSLKYNIPIIFLCQLNRAIEIGTQKRELKMSDLRDSGAIEQDADLIIFLSLDEQTEVGSVIINACISKGRNIGRGNVKLLFTPWITKFGQLARVDNIVER